MMKFLELVTHCRVVDQVSVFVDLFEWDGCEWVEAGQGFINFDSADKAESLCGAIQDLLGGKDHEAATLLWESYFSQANPLTVRFDTESQALTWLRDLRYRVRGDYPNHNEERVLLWLARHEPWHAASLEAVEVWERRGR